MGLIINSTFSGAQKANPSGPNPLDVELQEWRPVNLAAGVDMSEERNQPDARSGTSYLRAVTEEPGGSVAVDFQAVELAIEGADWNYSLATSIYVHAWVRAPQTDLDGTLTIWQIEPNVRNVQNIDRPFNIDQSTEWMMIENALDIITPERDLQHTVFRVEFYIQTPQSELNIDTVMVWQ